MTTVEYRHQFSTGATVSIIGDRSDAQSAAEEIAIALPIIAAAVEAEAERRNVVLGAQQAERERLAAKRR